MEVYKKFTLKYTKYIAFFRDTELMRKVEIVFNKSGLKLAFNAFHSFWAVPKPESRNCKKQ